jgi:hypothetical protein
LGITKKIKIHGQIIFYGLLLALWSCGASETKDTLFRLLKESSTGISFSNTITESYEFNIINYQDFYSGGGVSIGDINNDGLPDIFFTGNMVKNRLYLNQGRLAFSDITESAGLKNDDYTWCTGSTMVDINNDGWLDIYVGYSGLFPEDQRRNKLWINQGDNTFKDQAAKYGLDDPGYAVNANFFDFDKDGDLDMYLVNQGPEKNPYFDKTVSRDIPNEFCGDKLFRNDGDIFVDVTLQAGIYSSLIGFGHGAAVGDVDGDGWDDIYVCNDFIEHDYLYINSHDGTFRETLKKSFGHTSNYSMGNDMADFNNDGLLDMMVVDMVAEDNRRQKRMMSGMNAMMFRRAVDQGYHYQYMCNTLQLNNGNSTFSEIGHMAGVSNTDWSWGPLLADFDGDGYKDLFVSNGLRKDIRNRDWARQYNEYLDLFTSYELFSKKEWDELLDMLPAEKIPNYMYQNSQDMTFNNVIDEWGLDQASFSNGAAYGDLDNDGDLDLVVNNVDEPAFVYENLSNQKSSFNYLKINLKGPKDNVMALGAKVIVTTTTIERQMQQFYLTRGYRSSVDPILLFGCGTDTVVNEVQVIWPDNTLTTLQKLETNQNLLIDFNVVARVPEPVSDHQDKGYFIESNQEIGVEYMHAENDFDPYQHQPLLPYRLSELGPFLDVADVNGDELEDFFVGGASGKSGELYIQTLDGGFTKQYVEAFSTDRKYEDAGVLFFDIDGDMDQDLYVVSGGYEFSAENENYQDRVYINDGHGNFTRAPGAVPLIKSSGGKAIAGDYDNDGDLDLLVTGRQVPRKYPLPTDSYLLKNENGKLLNVTAEIAPELFELGMATDAIWSDTDLDGDLDFIIVGEWMALTLFENENGRFVRSQKITGLEHTVGWWNCIEKCDFDQDGDEDFIAGNLGLNYRYKTSGKYHFQVFASDFNDDGKHDILLSYYENGNLYPVENLERATIQLPELSGKIESHNVYSEMTISDIYGSQMLSQALNYQVNTFKTSYIENLGNGKFELTPLPNEAQISNTNAILIADYTADGKFDIIIGGNLYSSEEETTRLDAGRGLLLAGNGNGKFLPVTPFNSGLYLTGDIKDLKELKIGAGKYLIASRNSNSLQFVKTLDKMP